MSLSGFPIWNANWNIGDLQSSIASGQQIKDV